MKLDQAALEDVAESHNLRRAQADLLGKLIEALSEEWRYEPRIVPARSRRELWELLKHNARRSLPALLEAGLVAEHPGTGFEVLCWDQVVGDTARDYDLRRNRATKDLAAGDRRAATVEALYAASQVYELPASSEHNVHTTAHNARTSEHNVHSRPAVSRALEPLELQEPPLPPIDSPQEPSEDAGVGMESVPDTPAEVLNLEDKRAARYRSRVRAELARLEAEADAAAGTPIRSPGGYLAAIKRRLADDPELAAQIDAYQGQYPDDTPAELAGRIWADRAGSPGARPPSRPTNSVDLEGYAALVAAQNPELLEVIDLGGAR